MASRGARSTRSNYVVFLIDIICYWAGHTHRCGRTDTLPRLIYKDFHTVILMNSLIFDNVFSGTLSPTHFTSLWSLCLQKYYRFYQKCQFLTEIISLKVHYNLIYIKNTCIFWPTNQPQDLEFLIMWLSCYGILIGTLCVLQTDIHLTAYFPEQPG